MYQQAVCWKLFGSNGLPVLERAGTACDRANANAWASVPWLMTAWRPPRMSTVPFVFVLVFCVVLWVPVFVCMLVCTVGSQVGRYRVRVQGVAGAERDAQDGTQHLKRHRGVHASPHRRLFRPPATREVTACVRAHEAECCGMLVMYVMYVMYVAEN